MDLPAGDVLAVAPQLLGWTLTTRVGGLETRVRLTEVEAYAPDDPAAHSFIGLTERNATMFGPAGNLYVYRSYGIHWCANVVVGESGDASAVLLRGGIPVVGQSVMEQRRGRTDHLSDGPGKLCQALGIDGSFDGEPLTGPRVWLEPGDPPASHQATPRIGISKATERLWRFVSREGERTS